MSIKLMIVDDQHIIRDGLKSLASVHPTMTVVGEACNGKEALDVALRVNPDVVLMDIRMPIMDGVEATQKMKAQNPNTKILILTTFDDDAYIIKAMQYGASGYLLKDTDSEYLFKSIENAHQGHVILPGLVASKLIKHLPQATASKDIDPHFFTERERDIIQLLMEGYANQHIASTLYLSLGTVKNYVSQIYAKLYVQDRANAIIELKKYGF